MNAPTPHTDPNGLAASLVPVVTIVALLVGSELEAELVAAAVAGAIDTALILAARLRTWAPASVAALTPETVGPAGSLPAEE